MFVHPTYLVLSSASLSNKIFCVHFWSKIMLFSVPSTTAKWISFHNHRNRKVVGGKHNVLIHYLDICAPDPSSVVLCNLFIWDILWFIYFWSKIKLPKIHTLQSRPWCTINMDLVHPKKLLNESLHMGHTTDYPVTNHVQANMVYLLWRVYLCTGCTSPVT